MVKIQQKQSLLCITVILLLGFPGGSDGKESTCNAGNLGSIPGLGRSPGKGKSYPLKVFWAWRIPWAIWGRKESDMTERPTKKTPVFSCGPWDLQS